MIKQWLEERVKNVLVSSLAAIAMASAAGSGIGLGGEVRAETEGIPTVVVQSEEVNGRCVP